MVVHNINLYLYEQSRGEFTGGKLKYKLPKFTTSWQLWTVKSIRLLLISKSVRDYFLSPYPNTRSQPQIVVKGR